MDGHVGLFALNVKTQRWFVILGIVAVPLMFYGLGLAKALPAHNATWSAERIVAIYNHDSDAIQLGCVVAMIAFALWACWQATISVWIWRIEGSRYPVLTFSTLILVAINTLVVEAMTILYAVAAFRAGHINPEITLTINDLAWYFYYFTWPPYILWLVTIAIAIFRDERVKPIFPRWVAWLTLAQVVTILPNSIQTFSWALVGPFAWDGWFTNYLVGAFHGPWNFVVAYYVWRAITREKRALEADHTATETPAKV